MGSAPYLGGGFGHFYAYAPVKIEYAIDRFSMETKRQLDVLDRRLADNQFICGDEYTIADMAIMPWLRDPVKQGIDADKFQNLMRWRDKMWERPQVIAALETLAESRRTDNSFSDKGWEMMYGKTQSSQGAAAE